MNIIMYVKSAIVGFPHLIKGNGVYAFVICHNKIEDEDELKRELNDLVNKIVGPIAKQTRFNLFQDFLKLDQEK